MGALRDRTEKDRQGEWTQGREAQGPLGADWGDAKRPRCQRGSRFDGDEPVLPKTTDPRCVFPHPGALTVWLGRSVGPVYAGRRRADTSHRFCGELGGRRAHAVHPSRYSPECSRRRAQNGGEVVYNGRHQLRKYTGKILSVGRRRPSFWSTSDIRFGYSQSPRIERQRARRRRRRTAQRTTVRRRVAASSPATSRRTYVPLARSSTESRSWWRPGPTWGATVLTRRPSRS